MERLGASWERLGGVLERLGASSDDMWYLLGASWGHGCKEASWRPLGGLPGASWDPQKVAVINGVNQAQGQFDL